MTQSTEPMIPILHPYRLMRDMMAGVICQVLMILDMVQPWTDICKLHVPTRLDLLQVLVRVATSIHFNKCAMINSSGQPIQVVRAQVPDDHRTVAILLVDRVVEA